MRKFIKILSLLCIIAMLAGCGLVSKVEEKDTPKKETETVVTVDGMDYNIERFNLYFYNAQDEILKSAGFQETANIPGDFWTQKVDGEKTALDIAKETALTSLINDAVAYHKAVEYGLELTADEKSAITNQMASLRQDKVSISQFDYIGISVEELEKYYNEGFMIQHLIPELMKKGEIKVNDADAKSSMQEQYVKAKHILISTVDDAGSPLPDEQVAAAQKKAQEILDKINAGADFDELMNKESQDPGLASAPNGYVFTTGQMVAEFEEAAFALEEEQVSGLVNTSYGIHILKRVPFDMNASDEKEALESIKSQLAVPELETLIKTWKSETDIKTNDDVLKDLKPTITNNQEE